MDPREIKRILVATDFSESSQEAVTTAIVLLAKRRNPLFLS